MIRDDAQDDFQQFETPGEAFQYVRYAGTLEDDELDLGETALALALIFLPGLNPGRYRHHLKKLGDHLAEEVQVRARTEPDTLAMRVAALKKVVHEAHGYKGGDSAVDDDIQNVNFIRVIERRQGLPIALGLLYVILAKRLKWEIDGLNFPGHFLVRLEKDGERVILDPFNGKEMNAADLRQLLKTVSGAKAELSHNFYDTVSSRDMLIRLENNLKTRFIEAEEYAQALQVVQAMEALAPNEYRVLFDKGILYAKLNQPQQAAAALESYIDRTPHAGEKAQARQLVLQILSVRD